MADILSQKEIDSLLNRGITEDENDTKPQEKIETPIFKEIFSISKSCFPDIKDNPFEIGDLIVQKKVAEQTIRNLNHSIPVYSIVDIVDHNGNRLYKKNNDDCYYENLEIECMLYSDFLGVFKSRLQKISEDILYVLQNKQNCI